MGDISENINKIIYTNNLQSYFKAAKYRGVTDYLDDIKSVYADYYIDKHILKKY